MNTISDHKIELYNFIAGTEESIKFLFRSEAQEIVEFLETAHVYATASRNEYWGYWEVKK